MIFNFIPGNHLKLTPLHLSSISSQKGTGKGADAWPDLDTGLDYFCRLCDVYGIWQLFKYCDLFFLIPNKCSPSYLIMYCFP